MASRYLVSGEESSQRASCQTRTFPGAEPRTAATSLQPVVVREWDGASAPRAFCRQTLAVTYVEDIWFRWDQARAQDKCDSSEQSHLPANEREMAQGPGTRLVGMHCSWGGGRGATERNSSFIEPSIASSEEGEYGEIVGGNSNGSHVGKIEGRDEELEILVGGFQTLGRGAKRRDLQKLRDVEGYHVTEPEQEGNQHGGVVLPLAHELENSRAQTVLDNEVAMVVLRALVASDAQHLEQRERDAGKELPPPDVDVAKTKTDEQWTGAKDVENDRGNGVRTSWSRQQLLMLRPTGKRDGRKGGIRPGHTPMRDAVEHHASETGGDTAKGCVYRDREPADGCCMGRQCKGNAADVERIGFDGTIVGIQVRCRGNMPHSPQVENDGFWDVAGVVESPFNVMAVHVRREKDAGPQGLVVVQGALPGGGHQADGSPTDNIHAPFVDIVDERPQD
ncbi:hypothetical protein C8F01DRAFT_1091764 [Mycena amicta]|nr:hypothetical protein C8F01DRAFT_1091764 [Mycena amicta]